MKCSVCHANTYDPCVRDCLKSLLKNEFNLMKASSNLSTVLLLSHEKCYT